MFATRAIRPSTLSTVAMMPMTRAAVALPAPCIPGLAAMMPCALRALMMASGPRMNPKQKMLTIA